MRLLPVFTLAALGAAGCGLVTGVEHPCGDLMREVRTERGEPPEIRHYEYRRVDTSTVWYEEWLYPDSPRAFSWGGDITGCWTA